MKKIIETDVEDIVIRFTGDSGDGMQMTGNLFTDTSAYIGNGVSTFPDYPAEIRAPLGTVAGVSGFQVHFGSTPIKTPGDYCDILVAMNPAALKANYIWLKKVATIIVNIDAFTEKNIEKAGFKTNDPFAELGLEGYNIVLAPISSLTVEALKESGLDNKSMLKCKNMFALGICFFMCSRPMTHTEAFLDKKFGVKKPAVAAANKLVLHAGFNYAANTHTLSNIYKIAPATLEKGNYRSISGNQAAAWGLMAASEKSNLPLFCGSYPITPATVILEELAKYKSLGVKTVQAEDEIAGICTAIGASFAGNLAVTTTSGPGLALKSEAAGLAVITELPLVIIDVQRGGPSTGLPTKTEQSDLSQALYGRNGESPLCVVAGTSPSNCFDAAFYAAKIALEHMTPVVLLNDGFIANGSEPWKYPSMSEYPTINPPFAESIAEGEHFSPYIRDEKTLVRHWAIPGTPNQEHRIGGLEKDYKTGAISHDAKNHQVMTDARDNKIARIADCIPEQEIIGSQDGGEVLVIGWGGTFGHLESAVGDMRKEGKDVSLCHFSFINPLPKNTADIFSKFKKIVVCELNMGQFANYLRTKFPHLTFNKYNKVEGQPFTTVELKDCFTNLLEK